MRITEAGLRQIIREMLLREALLPDAKVGPMASVSPDSDVGNSAIGYDSGDPTDNSSVSDSSTVINSSISGGSQVKSSSVDDSDIGGGSTVTRTNISSCYLLGSKINSATIKSEIPDPHGDLRVAEPALRVAIMNSEISNAVVKTSYIKDSKITGGAKINRSHIAASELHGTSTDKAYLGSVKSTGSTIISRDKRFRVENATINYAEVVDSLITGGTIMCERGSRAYLEKVHMSGTPRITGSPQIIGLVGPEGRVQPARITDNAQISGSPKISGLVGDNARVSGNAEVHGLAQIVGDCVVTGTARMISGRFTTGTYDSGTHEGGDSLVTSVLKGFGL